MLNAYLRLAVCVLGMGLVAALPAHAQDRADRYGNYREAQPGRFVSLIKPDYLAANEVRLPDEAPVVGIAVGTDARCFPIRQLWYHHVVNDEIGGQRLAVTYCVMANTAVTYRIPDLKQNALQVGGLYGGVLALAPWSGSGRWPQIAIRSAPGCATSSTLTLGPAPSVTTWKRWKTAYPDTKVLKPVDRFSLSYEAYEQRPRGYSANPLMNETVVVHDQRLKPGDEVFGVANGDRAKAWLLTELKKSRHVEDKLGTATVRIQWDDTLETPALIDGSSTDLLSCRAYWYAWSSFYPDTELGTPANPSVTAHP